MKKRLPSPKKKGVAKVPVVMQMENMECGAASLAMILAYYGKWVPLSTLRDTCGISRDGAKMSSIAHAARTLGLNAQGYRYEPDEFFRDATFPCVVHWRFTHFVVVCGRRGNTVFINDPAGGSVRVTMEEFDEAFTGVSTENPPEISAAFESVPSRTGTLIFRLGISNMIFSFSSFRRYNSRLIFVSTNYRRFQCSLFR